LTAVFGVDAETIGDLEPIRDPSVDEPLNALSRPQVADRLE